MLPPSGISSVLMFLTDSMNQFLDRVLRWLRWHKVLPHIEDGAKVCDIGCGPHVQFLREISGRIRRGVGLDKRVENYTEGNIEVKQVYIEDKLPLAFQSVDTVTMLAMLEHLENHIQILEECHRILTPGGKILITVPTVWNKPIGEFLAYQLHVIEEEQYRDHKRYYRKETLKMDLEEAGFVVHTLSYWELGMNLFAYATKP